MQSIEAHIHTHITALGPMRLGEFMALCLGHPQFGYYQQQQPFGTSGDFITAPLLTPLFGEMLGVWVVEKWHAMGCPTALQLVEIGGGTGVLMADMLRIIARLAPQLYTNLHVHMVEFSPRLQAIQRAAIAHHTCTLTWHTALSQVPHAPTLLMANELFDALPIYQYEYHKNMWHERCVGLDEHANLTFTLSPRAEILYPFPPALTHAHNGAIVEYCPAAQGLMDEICARITSHSGAALIIDYGYEGPAFGDTFQALRGHVYANPLEHLGQADLTAHVDFGALKLWAQHYQHLVTTLSSQSEFLQSMGIIQRYEQVLHTLPSDQQPILTSAIERLLSPQQMGTLFKVLMIENILNSPHTGCL